MFRSTSEAADALLQHRPVRSIVRRLALLPLLHQAGSQEHVRVMAEQRQADAQPFGDGRAGLFSMLDELTYEPDPQGIAQGREDLGLTFRGDVGPRHGSSIEP
jgi:hypothetical protein